MSTLPLLCGLAAAQAEPTIIVTGAREPLEADESAVAATTFDQRVIEALATPAVVDLLRLSPGVAVAVTGPRGTQTQLRIRGNEANHSLLFVDGIRFNDPAAGNEARFELLTADLLSRIEIVRGPQSALWGSEALGGVIAVETADPIRAPGLAILGEQGDLDTSRLFGRVGLQTGELGGTAAFGWQRSDGIDSFGADGERDGFSIWSATAKAAYRRGSFELGAVGHWIEGESEFDGFDPLSFRRADTLDETHNRIGAVRGWANGAWGDWSVRVEASYLDSVNRNRLGNAPLNRTLGERLALGTQISRRLGGHRFIAAIDRQEEDFRARDTVFLGGTDQDRSRSVTGWIGEWRAEWSPALITDVVVRHDNFSAFADATTWRAAIILRPAPAWMLHAAYGEGIAQPTFYDLHGFFPGSFVGNPDLKPEHSRGWEALIRWQQARFSLAATGFSSRVRDEIVETFDPETFLSSTVNAVGRNRRKGLELEAGYDHADWLALRLNYTFLDANEPDVGAESFRREARRPRHTANLIAFGVRNRFAWSTSVAYVGARTDTDFDLFPAPTVRLDDYWLGSLRVAYQVLPQLELFARAENALDARYQDVIGYRTPGRTIHAGLRVTIGR